MYIHVSEFVYMKLIFKEEIMKLWGYRGVVEGNRGQ